MQKLTWPGGAIGVRAKFSLMELDLTPVTVELTGQVGVGQYSQSRTGGGAMRDTIHPYCDVIHKYVDP